MDFLLCLSSWLLHNMPLGNKCRGLLRVIVFSTVQMYTNQLGPGQSGSDKELSHQGSLLLGSCAGKRPFPLQKSPTKLWRSDEEDTQKHRSDKRLGSTCIIQSTIHKLQRTVLMWVTFDMSSNFGCGIHGNRSKSNCDLQDFSAHRISQPCPLLITAPGAELQ